MPYTIILCDDNSLYGSCKRRIMQREKLFNELWILVPPHYNGYDMSQCTLTMRYLSPISRELKTETLTLSKDKYKEYLMYTVPIDTKLTKEWGDVRFNLTFTMLDVDDFGGIVQRVRKTEDYVLSITQLPNWDSVIPDSALEAIDQRILKQDAQIRALADLANVIDSNMVDNLVYDSNKETLQLSANGIGIGNKVSVREMLDDGVPVIDLNSTGSSDDNDDNGNDNNSSGCDCGCEHDIDVVEF